MPRYPFTPELLDALPEELAELFRGLELKLLEEICSRLKIADQLNEVTVQDIRALRAMGIDLKDIKKAIAETNDVGMDKLEKLLDDVVERNQKYYTSVIDLAGVTAPPYLVNEADIAAIRRQTWAAYKNITGSMGFLVARGGRLTLLPPAKAYEWALDSALLQVQTGAISYEQAISSAVRELADRGLCVAYDKNGNVLKNRVAYESGHINHLDVAVRRAVMTGVNQLNAKYRDQSMDILQTDLVQVQAHSCARDIDGPMGWENHKRWQGRIYRWKGYTEKYPNASKGQYKDFEETCGLGDVTGILGANCRHSYTAFLEGVMGPTYSEEYLAHIDDGLGCDFEGKHYSAYAATQKQRQIEESIRKRKRRKAGAVTEDDKATANAKLRALNKKYRDFSAAAGLPEQWERTKVLYAK